MAPGAWFSHYVTVSPTPADDLPPELVAGYLENVRAQLQTLAQLADRLALSPTDRDALDSIRHEAHKIRGSAGSFGFPLATDTARALEETIKDWLASGPPASAAAAVHRAVGALRQALHPGGAIAATEQPAATATPGGVPEVIVVEDDPALADLLCYGLDSRDYRYAAFRNGREALEALLALDTAGTRPVLLLDVDLPGIDGYAVFERLQEARPGAYRAVFLTVHGSEEEQLRGLEAGAIDYLVKPVMLRVALEKIKRWVGR